MNERAWATKAREALANGQSVQVRPRGHSVTGRINDGDLVTLEPCRAEDLAIGDVVLVRVRGWLLVLHQILDREPDRFLIGTPAGRADEWVSADEIFGRVTKVKSLNEPEA
jgi:hypothetical protein